MNLSQSILNIAVLFLSFSNTALFGMLVPRDAIFCSQKDGIFPPELMITAAAHGDGKVKNNLQKTCALFKYSLSRDNVEFLSHPSFTAHKDDVEDIMCSAVWFNRDDIEKALKTNYDIKKISFTTTLKEPHFDKLSCCIGMTLDDLRTLRSKHNNRNKIDSTYILMWEVEPAFYCAVKCNDSEAVHNISLRIKEHVSYVYGDGSYIIKLHCGLLLSVIRKDQVEMFELLVKNDPFKALNSCYCPFQLNCSMSFLDVLNVPKDISQDKKNSYAALYRKYGGKTFDELEKEKEKQNNQCIMS